MTQTVSVSPSAAAGLPPAVSLGESWPWLAFASTALALLLYFVGVDEGASSLLRGADVHEVVHDARHLLGFPCH